MKRIFIPILFIMQICISCADSADYFPVDWDESSASVKVMKDDVMKDERIPVKLMSFNVRYATGDKGTVNAWDLRKEDLFLMIDTEKPLVIGTQECQISQKRDMEESCPEYGAIGVGRNDGEDSGETCSIFYHKASCSIEDWGSFWLSETPDVPGKKGWDAATVRVATWARVKVTASGKEFFFINTHLDHKGRIARAEGMNLIMSKFRELNKDNLPQLLTADFNTSQNDDIFRECLLTMKNARLTAPETDNENTYNGYGDGSSIIDHIFLSGFDILKYKTVNQAWDDTEYISDHYPVYALVKFSY